MARPNIVADSTWYIRFLDNISMPEALLKYLEIYCCFYGCRIYREISKSVNFKKIKGAFEKNCVVYDVQEFDYIELFRPIFTREERHTYDGEYEAIFIAYKLNEEGRLSYLILSDKSPRNLVMNNFSDLSNKLRWIEEFLRDSCIVDNKLEKETVMALLDQILLKAKVNMCRVPPKEVFKYINQINTCVG